MVITLAARGHHVTVAARRRRDWRSLRDELPLPKTLSIKYLLPDSDLSRPKRLLALLFGLPAIVIRRPRATLRLFRLCCTHPETKGSALRSFIRHLPFLPLQAQVVQFDFPMTAHAYALLADILHAPTVVSCRGSDVHMLEQRDKANRKARLWSLCHATALHCVSEEMAGEVARLTGRTEGIWVNRPAVPVDRLVPKANYILDEPPLIIAVGYLTWIKGFDYLLAALARLKQAGLLFRAQIIGNGELYAVLRFSIGDLGLSDRVKLTGALPSDQVFQRLREADLFVLSSHEEGISNAALEAMAVGLPIVTTNAGGMAEVVQDGVEGYVVPVRDMAAMAARIGRLLTNPTLREQMGRAARARAEAGFSLERQAHVFEEIFTNILGK